MRSKSRMAQRWILITVMLVVFASNVNHVAAASLVRPPARKALSFWGGSKKVSDALQILAVRPPARKALTFWGGSKKVLDALQVHISLAGYKHMRVSWMSPTNAQDKAPEVQYGLISGNYTSMAIGTESYSFLLYSGTMNHVVIGPLSDSTTYYYICGGAGEEYKFKTPITVGDGGNREGLARKFYENSPDWSVLAAGGRQLLHAESKGKYLRGELGAELTKKKRMRKYKNMPPRDPLDMFILELHNRFPEWRLRDLFLLSGQLQSYLDADAINRFFIFCDEFPELVGMIDGSTILVLILFVVRDTLGHTDLTALFTSFPAFVVVLAFLLLLYGPVHALQRFLSFLSRLPGKKRS